MYTMIKQVTSHKRVILQPTGVKLGRWKLRNFLFVQVLNKSTYSSVLITLFLVQVLQITKNDHNYRCLEL